MPGVWRPPGGNPGHYQVPVTSLAPHNSPASSDIPLRPRGPPASIPKSLEQSTHVPFYGLAQRPPHDFTPSPTRRAGPAGILTEYFRLFCNLTLKLSPCFNSLVPIRRHVLTNSQASRHRKSHNPINRHTYKYYERNRF